MSLFEVPLSAIDAARLDALVTDNIRERRQIEYKEALWPRTSEGAKEFLADVSSFANAIGGDIVVGVRDRRDAQGRATGEPEAVVGLPGVNIGAESLRLQQILQAGVDPRLVGVEFSPVSRAPDPDCLIIRVPRSYVGLHMVRETGRFHSRNSNGRYPLDATEIRRAILGRAEAQERLPRWRAERVARINALEAPVPLGAGPKVIFHAIPIAESGFGARALARPADEIASHLSPVDAYAATWHHNLDGLLVRSGEDARGVSYVQLFRDGTLETVGVRGARPLAPGANSSGMFDNSPVEGIGAWHLEWRLIDLLGRWMGRWATLGESGPMMLALALTGVKGLRLFPHSEAFNALQIQIDRDVLLIPEVVVEDFSRPPDVILHPILDMMWNAGGWRGSPHYHEGRFQDFSRR